MTPEEEAAIEEAERRAKKFLFWRGKPRGIDDLLKLQTLDFIFRPVSPAEQVNPRAGLDFVSWRGQLYVYDALVAKGFINEAKSEDYYCDRIVRNAAVLLLDATKGISDDRLRIYVINSLSGNNPDLKIDRRHMGTLDIYWGRKARQRAPTAPKLKSGGPRECGKRWNEARRWRHHEGRRRQWDYRLCTRKP